MAVECVTCIGLAELLPHLQDESLADERENVDLADRLDTLTWRMYDSREQVLHTIARKIDAHEDLWIPLAQHLGIDKKDIDIMFLSENGGGSPSKYFLRKLDTDAVPMTVGEFKDGARSCNLLGVVDILKDEEDGARLQDLLLGPYVDMQLYLELPRCAPRWKILAEHFSTPIDRAKLREHIRRPGMYSPANLAITRYLQMYPGQFRRIGEFLVRERTIIFPCKAAHPTKYRTIGEFLLKGQKLIMPPDSRDAAGGL